MGITEILSSKRNKILKAAARHGAKNVRVFGSVAEGRATRTSDVDFLIDMQAGRTLVDLVGLSQELEILLARRVDVVTARGLSPYLRRSILSQAVPL